MIVASGIAMQFGANGCGKSTFMKILGGELEPGAGTVAIDANERAGELLLGLGVPTAQHEGLMSAVAPGWKLGPLPCKL